MCALIQRINGQPSLHAGNGHVHITLIRIDPRQGSQCLSQLAPQRFRLGRLPLVKGRTITQGETRQKILAIEANRLFQRARRFGPSRALQLPQAQRALIAHHIYPRIGSWIQAHHLSVSGDQAFA